MVIVGLDILAGLTASTVAAAKMVFNAHGALIFPATEEHRNQKATGLSYEDNYEGNALAAMLRPGKIDIRYHGKFSDSQVSSILSKLVAQPELSCMAGWSVTYQGRPLLSPAG